MIRSLSRAGFDNTLPIVKNHHSSWGKAGPSEVPLRKLLYVYYAFIFTLPLQLVNIGISDFGLSKLFGYGLILLSLTQPKLCFRDPPKVFWCFITYLAVYVLLSFPVILDAEKTYLAPQIISQLITQVQLLILFWISYNLLRSDRVKKATLLAMALSCILITITLTVRGAAGEQADPGSSVAQTAGRAAGEQIERQSAFGENPNITATVLSLGLLALVGLAYGQRYDNAKKFRILAWLTGPLLLISVVRTGSRGGLVALLLALFALVMKPHSLRQNLKAGLVVLLAVITLASASYQIEFIRERWQRTYEEGDVAGREEIFYAARDMFLQSPLIGWGPINHLFELGTRLGLTFRDPHNVYMWVLNETGILGAIPFFAGLWFCWSAAWNARKGSQAVVPIAMLGYLLLANLKGTGHLDKYFWVILGYSVAAGSHMRAPGRSIVTASVHGSTDRGVSKHRPVTRFVPKIR